MNVVQRFKSLPISSRKLLSLGIVMALVVALPLFIWAIVTQNFNPFKKAASGEPLPTPTNNFVNWNTPYVSLTASNFYINVDGDKLFVSNPSINVHSDSGDDTYTSLELFWQENGVSMGMTIYFNMENNTWKISEVRTGDGNPQGTTLFYTGFNGGASKGSPLIIDNLNITSDNNRGIIHFENLNLQAFLPLNLPISQAGYILEPKPVIDNIPMTYTQSGGSSYGVNVVLRNSNSDIVTNQSNINYQWITSNSNIITVNSSTLLQYNQTCSYGIQLPCPYNHGDITATGVGNATVTVNAIDKNNGNILASTVFNIIVNQLTQSPYPTASPTPFGSPTPSASPSPRKPLDFRVKFSGVTDGSADGAKAIIRFVSGFINVVTPPVEFKHTGNGVYEAIISPFGYYLPFLGNGSGYTIYIKGEKHISNKFCRMIGQIGPCSGVGNIPVPEVTAEPVSLYDFTGYPLEPGDLSPQNGVANGDDFAKIKDLLSKPCDQLSSSEKLTADLDYNGCVNVRDAFLMRQTLQTRYDEN